MIITLDGNRILVDLDGQRDHELGYRRVRVAGAQSSGMNPNANRSGPRPAISACRIMIPGDVVWFKEVSVKPLGGAK